MTKQFIADTNVLMDMSKPEGAKDVSEQERNAAAQILAILLGESEICLGYCSGMLKEWKAKGLLEQDTTYRAILILLETEKLIEVNPVRISKGKRSDCEQHVDADDQIFVLAAAAIAHKKKYCVTRDPKTTKPLSRQYVKRVFSVSIALASEFLKLVG